jgi:hypothetical protein
MRELKFRQYIESPTGRHVFFFWGYLTGDGVFTCPKTGPSEQYTGIKDKNGKEVYEGDIVDCRVSPYEPGYKALDLHGVVVSYHEGSLVIGQCSEWFCSDYTVIGNIHENPELVSNRASD